MKSPLLFLFAVVALAAAEPAAPTTATKKRAEAPPSPSLQPITDVPGLPRVLLIGDSVSMGYTVRVRALLDRRANVHRAPTNCGPTTKGIAEIDRWLGDGHWDVIHFNFGLHDVRQLDGGRLNVPRDVYEANLRTLVARLKRTGARLIWATTTPVPAQLRPGQYPRTPSDIGDYNAIAARVMAENSIGIDDLYATVLPRIRELQPADDVHFNPAGYDVLAAKVAASIGAALPATSADAAPEIAAVESRVWSCEFTSKALGRPMRFLVVLPVGATLRSPKLPVIYFLHGRGRNERTLLEQPATRGRVLASPCAVVLPRGLDGWYVNSPTIAEDRFADYVDEVIALAERMFPVGGSPRLRAIGGWSMGGYGATYTAGRRAGDFAALAPIIGILDFPRRDIAEPGQNYAVPARFGTDAERWNAFNPRLMIPRLKATPMFLAYADQAAERQMNETFIADARNAGVAIEAMRMHGGHTFPIVAEGLPPAFAFMEKILQPTGRRDDGFTVVESLDALRECLPRSGVKVRLSPGTYRVTHASSPNFLDFTGSDSHYDFSGVRLEVDTKVAEGTKEGTNLVMLSGSRITFEGLTLLTTGNRPSGGGCRGISISGDAVVLRNVSLTMEGSYPYGYGSYFGIGQGASVALKKINGIRIGGLDVQVVDCRVIMRGFGHGIFIRGAQRALVKGCYVEGALRKTDDILAEKSGPAFDRGFKQFTGTPIPAGKMTSLSEDGIRAYPNDPEIKRRTQDIRVENCRVTRMRRGICLAYAGGRNSITGCEVTECERVAFHVQTDTTIRDCRGDALYSQVLDVSTTHAKGSEIELTVLDSRRFYGHQVLATINGSGHRVVLKEASPGFVPAALTANLALARSAPGEEAEESGASRVELSNHTPAPVILHAAATDCTVSSVGPVTDHGKNNVVKRAAR